MNTRTLVNVLIAGLAGLWLAGAAPAEASMLVSEPAIRVHVGGAVKRPGVYRVPAGSRVAEAIAAAGGPARKADLAALNLAALLEDGEQFLVPTPGASPRVAPAQAPQTASGQTRRRAGNRAAQPVRAVALNRANAQELQTLPGVGPAMAARILQVRTRLGRFSALEELREVPGIGPKRLAKLRPRLVLD